MSNNIVFQIQDVTKRYGAIDALRGITFSLAEREILGIVGDNAAGKSTLLKILSGIVPPTSGALYVNGHPVSFHDTLDARRLGIEVVYQDLMLAPNLDIIDNIFLGRPLTRCGVLAKLDHRSMAKRAQIIASELGFDSQRIPLSTRVDKLSGGQQQSVAIMRAMAFVPHTILLDEPTASMSQRFIDNFHKVLLDLRQNSNVAMIYVTHRLPDALAICDRILVMKSGRIIAERLPATTNVSDLVTLMSHEMGESLES